jgi:hypothetical protein
MKLLAVVLCMMMMAVTAVLAQDEAPTSAEGATQRFVFSSPLIAK